MNSVIEIFNRQIALNEKIAVAISGGSDSMCLIDIILRYNLKDKSDILAVNFEHGIRGEESVRDSQFVKDYCEKNGIELYFTKADIPKKAKQSGLSVETEARLFRRAEFDLLINSGRVTSVLTAHNASDQTETVLMHIFRGTGLRGLIGMQERDGYVVRPLISTLKPKILDYVTANNVPFVCDSTNNHSQYTRNYLRNEILPLIRARWQGVDNAIANLSANALETYDGSLRGFALIYDEDSVLIPLNNLSARAIFDGLSSLKVYADITKKHIDSILALKDMRVSSGAHLPHSARAVREHSHIRLYIKSDSATDAEVPCIMGEHNLCGIKIVVAPCNAIVELGKTRLDFDKIPKGAVIRLKRDKDKFKPCGGKNKLLSDFFNERKIPVYERLRLPLIAVGSEVFAVANVEIADSVKITPHTKSAAEFKVL